ncbi:OLC1v1005853C1 [Oldenlandia corymbosa var. corymbosa]|uniref:OLC1v1005853C1 n=1 Tax=Oldenlandia corymbosa var. corymbosa TaxID=529605 RepID=A0AAV1DHY2_OLDCO|nr:OLC1v1005853C1 [Oldenlandia corymbosa var. corymbosa]
MQLLLDLGGGSSKSDISLYKRTPTGVDQVGKSCSKIKATSMVVDLRLGTQPHVVDDDLCQNGCSPLASDPINFLTINSSVVLSAIAPGVLLGRNHLLGHFGVETQHSVRPCPVSCLVATVFLGASGSERSTRCDRVRCLSWSQPFAWTL